MQTSRLIERVQQLGVGSASPVDLVAVGFARREVDVDGGEEAARAFLMSGQRLQGLANLSRLHLEEAFGLDRFEAIRAQALVELGRRSGLAGKGPITSISKPDDVAELLDYLRLEKREHFVAVMLDAKNNVMRTSSIHIGTLTASLVGPREVFREAIREGASSLIVAHNHPSGDPTPSPEDIEVTRRLKEVGDLLDIPLLDHVIVGDKRWTSLNQAGHL